MYVASHTIAMAHGRSFGGRGSDDARTGALREQRAPELRNL
ncbi:hypothetical protein QFZ58_000735 [Streptomyces sp. B1I3]|nr:hypothetical protein [Streptomyces sp. B1I3]